MSLAGFLSRTFAPRFLAVASAALLLSGCMTLDQDRAIQRPLLPESSAVVWSPANRLYRGVTLDYITGMDRRSYLFGSANQSAFRPLLEGALAETDLLAPTALAARYGLQVEFKQLDGTALGRDFTATSVAVYRIVDRTNGQVMFQSEVPAAFNAQFRSLNEDDAALAYRWSVNPETAAWGLIWPEGPGRAPSEPLNLGTAAVTTAAIGRSMSAAELHDTWRALRYRSIYMAVVGPALVAYNIVDPFNYYAGPNFYGAPPQTPVLGARQGELSTQGVGARNGSERRRQADFMMMGQSLTKFVIALSDSERVPVTTIVPCLDTPQIQAIKLDLLQRGLPYRTDDCMAYQRRNDPNGRIFTPYR
jgi:hypothetical protein